MSTAAAAKSKQDRTAKAIASSPKVTRLREKAASAPEPTPDAAPIAAGVPASSIEMVPFRRLRRAPENVRRHRPDEDIEPLAEDIAAHGLLQSLIGYKAVHPLRGEKNDDGDIFYWIAGGGRRLKALEFLVDADRMSLDEPIAVLIRDRSEAIELSLSENLGKRDMSPVDECVAFTALIKRGNTNEEELAKRFGFTERYVKQRLRLAELAKPILDALGDRKITLDAAMAYATSSDCDLQERIFQNQEKSYHSHNPINIRGAYSTAQLNTGSVLYTFAGAEAYERRGGRYEDDLFTASNVASQVRNLADGPVLLEAARECAELQMVALEEKTREEYPALKSLVLSPSVRLEVTPWHPKPPQDYVLIEGDWRLHVSELWKNAKRLHTPIIAIAGVSYGGTLEIKQTAFFAPKDAADKVKPTAPTSIRSEYTPPTPEERAAAQREAEVHKIASRLAVGSFVGTPFAGRAFWPARWIDPIEENGKAGLGEGRLVAVQIFISEADYLAQLEEAGRVFEQQVADRAADQQAREDRAAGHADRVLEVAAMDPLPAVIVLDGPDDRQPWFLRADGRYADSRVAEMEEHDGFDGVSELLVQTDAGELIETFADLAAFDASQGRA